MYSNFLNVNIYYLFLDFIKYAENKINCFFKAANNLFFNFFR